jgi:hypothetical protein
MVISNRVGVLLFFSKTAGVSTEPSFLNVPGVLVYVSLVPWIRMYMESMAVSSIPFGSVSLFVQNIGMSTKSLVIFLRDSDHIYFCRSYSLPDTYEGWSQILFRRLNWCPVKGRVDAGGPRHTPDVSTGHRRTVSPSSYDGVTRHASHHEPSSSTVFSDCILSCCRSTRHEFTFVEPSCRYDEVAASRLLTSPVNAAGIVSSASYASALRTSSRSCAVWTVPALLTAEADPNVTSLIACLLK